MVTDLEQQILAIAADLDVHRAVFRFGVTQRVTQEVLQQQRDAGRVDVRADVPVCDIDFFSSSCWFPR